MRGSDVLFDRRAVIGALPALSFAAWGCDTGRSATPDADAQSQPSAGPQALQGLIDQQAAAGGTIVVAPGPPLAVTGAVRLPADATLVVQRDLVGAEGAALLLSGRSQVRFVGSRVTDVCMKLLAGGVTLSGLRYSGRKEIAAVLIGGPGPYANPRIDGFEIADANYGILRQGSGSSLVGATVANGVFRNLFGDAIEWNVCPNDRGVVIENQDIQGIDAPAGKPNWGIGVGIAGAGYTPDWDPARSAKQFTIRNVTGRALRQLVHVESGVDFTIEHIVGEDISPSYSTASGLELGSVVCYGCRGFTIADVRADARVLIASGTLNGRYVVPCSDVVLQDINLARGDLEIEVGGKQSYARLERVTLGAGTLAIRGAARDLSLADVAVTSKSGADQPFTSDKTFLSGSLAGFLPDQPTVRQRDVRLLRGR